MLKNVLVLARSYYFLIVFLITEFVVPCQHGMARLQFADGGMASDMEGSCEYIE